MTERLATANHLPNDKHLTLYKHWASAGAGLMISGNVIVDKKHLEAGGNVVIGKHQEKAPFLGWTHVATASGNHFWAQISHAGRQANVFSNLNPQSASDIKLRKLGFFAKPVPMTESTIEQTIDLFVEGAEFCQEVGFTGVQFHAAHGYLLSQFLSPRTNKRQDRWGGSIENRGRMLFEIVRQARRKLGPSFPISVKLNSADFQRGGFEQHDAMFVIKRLEDMGIDLLEISGGTYENLVFLTEQRSRKSTQSREAYFLTFAEEVRKECAIPLMVTGGFRSLDFTRQALNTGALDVIGFARPFLIDSSFPKGFLDGTQDRVDQPVLKPFSDKYLDLAEGGYYDKQIEELARGNGLRPNYSGNRAIFRFITKETKDGIRNLMAG